MGLVPYVSEDQVMDDEAQLCLCGRPIERIKYATASGFEWRYPRECKRCAEDIAADEWRAQRKHERLENRTRGW
jgi:hypothetical protein